MDSTSPQRILVANAWGSNRGDEAMLNTLYRLITSIAPGATVDIAPFRDEDLDVDPGMRVQRDRIGIHRYVGMPSPVARRGRHRAVRPVLRRLVARPQVWRRPLRRFVESYDLVLHAPQGPGIGDMYPDLKLDLLRILETARLAGVPYAMAGVSLGPFEDGTPDERYTSDVLQAAEAIVVREDISLAHVLARYPQLDNVQAAIDIVYALAPAPGLDGDGRLGEVASSVDAGTIGACISLTPARDPGNAFDVDGYVAGFVALLDHVLRTTSAPIVLFPHIAHDLPQLERIARSVTAPDRVRILPPELDSDAQRAVIAKLGFFISSRYHPTVFAVQSQVPFLCIKNQFKVEGMLDKLGLGALPACWQDEPLDVQRRAFDESWNARDEIRSALGGAAARAEALAATYRETLSAVLAPAPAAYEVWAAPQAVGASSA